MLAGAGLWAWRFPLSVHEAFQALSLRLSGVRSIRVAGFRGLARESCAGARDCRCVVLIHGLGDESGTWADILSGPVPDGTRIYAFDMPGTGGSSPPASPEGYAIPEQARALRGALEPLCPRWTAVGNSLGGWIAAWLALQWPAGVERLVLLSPAGLQDPSGLSRQAALTLSSPSAESMRAFADKAWFAPRSYPRRVWEQVAERVRSRPVSAIVRAVRPEDFLDGKLGGLRMPADVLWGDSDRVIPPAQGERFAAALPQGRLVVLPRCGHQPQLECPAPVRAAVFIAGAGR